MLLGQQNYDVTSLPEILFVRTSHEFARQHAHFAAWALMKSPMNRLEALLLRELNINNSGQATSQGCRVALQGHAVHLKPMQFYEPPSLR